MIVHCGVHVDTTGKKVGVKKTHPGPSASQCKKGGDGPIKTVIVLGHNLYIMSRSSLENSPRSKSRQPDCVVLQ